LRAINTSSPKLSHWSIKRDTVAQKSPAPSILSLCITSFKMSTWISGDTEIRPMTRLNMRKRAAASRQHVKTIESVKITNKESSEFEFSVDEAIKD
jgi:hypothetical protein